MESEKYILKTGRTNKKYKTFQDSMNYLKAQKSIVHEGELSKPLYDVFVDVAAVFTHVSYLKKDTEVICLNLGERIHVITPLVILEISASDYSFIAAYKHGAFCIDRTSVEWKERHEYYTWLHARRDGGPDLRYSYNPQQLNYSYSTHRTDNAICIRIGEKSEKYEIEKKTRDYIMKYKNQFQLT